MSNNRLQRLEEDANFVAKKVAAHPLNRTNPFAYGRAHSMVMNDIMTRKEFADADYHPADVH